MGCGKSTLGPDLAERLGVGFIDLDDVIEAQTGEAIPHLFERGEHVFREAETQALSVVVREHVQGLVVALGGGAFLSERNRLLLGASGVSIWFDVPTGELVDRLLRSSRARPILMDGERKLTRAELTDRVTDLMGQRREAYLQADIRLSVRVGSTVEENVRRTLDALEGLK